MKLLIVTQKVDMNDDVLGFFHDWLREFARQVESIEVIALHVGKYDLPANVKIHSLGKEKGSSKFAQLLRFTRYSLQVTRYDAVFVHMNPIYLVLAGWWWRLTGKKVVLWYTHRNVDLKLSIAEKFANYIATASPESFKLESKKVKVLGHGVNTARFQRSDLKGAQGPTSGPVSILCVGRITPIKHQDVLIAALDILIDRKIVDAKVEFVGAPIYAEDLKYELYLKEYTQLNHLQDRVSFAGSVPNHDLPNYYWRANVAANILPDGGLDKVVFESLAAGVPTLTTNRAFESLKLPGLVVCDLHPETVASSLAQIIANPPNVDTDRVVREFSVESVVAKILKLYD